MKPLLIVALLLAACAPLEERPERAEPAAIQVDEALDAAEAATERDDHRAAATHLMEAAASLDPPESVHFRLRAVDAFIRAGQWDEAEAVLEATDVSGLTEAWAARRALVRGRLAIARDAPTQALEYMPRPAEDLPAALQADIYEGRARALALMDEPAGAVREYMARAEVLETDEAREANRDALWAVLESLPQDERRYLGVTAEPETVRAWFRLAHIAGTERAEPERFEHRLEDWRQEHRDHPAEVHARELLEEHRLAMAHPSRIALLLPLSGRFAEAGQAVRDGFLAAYYADRSQGSERPTVRVYDAGDGDVVGAYRQAVAEGAQFVVGPLDRDAVTALAREEELETGVLALNYARDGNPAPQGMIQLGLSPEDEARQVADRAYLDGLRRTVALVPHGEWGERVFDAFRERFESLGGTVLAQERYLQDESDYTRPIQSALLLDHSRERHRALSGVLGTNPEFEPRRRRDVDFVFVGAFPTHARLLRPQLRFHRAGDLPVYATSHVYTGSPNPGDDRDMDGITFPDMPWNLAEPQNTERRVLEEVWPDNMDQLTRLYALGVDAYRVIPYLDRLRSGDYPQFDGVTGRLHAESDGRLSRDLDWARFSRGRPVRVEFTAVHPVELAD